MREPLIELGVINYLRELCFKRDYHFTYILASDNEAVEMWDLNKEEDSIYIQRINEEDVEIFKVTKGHFKPVDVTNKQSEVIEIVRKLIEK